VKLESDVNFLNAYRVKDFVAGLYVKPPAPMTATSALNERAFYTITTTLDKIFRPAVLVGVEEVPNAIAIDYSMVRQTDITGMKVILETLEEGRTRGVRFVIFNIHPELAPQLKKYGIVNDESTKQVNLDKYLALSTLPTKEFKYVVADGSVSGSDSNNNKEDRGLDVEGGLMDANSQLALREDTSDGKGIELSSVAGYRVIPVEPVTDN